MTSIHHEFNLDVTAVAQTIRAFTALPRDTEADHVNICAREALTLLSEQCAQLEHGVKHLAAMSTIESDPAELWLDGGVLGALAQMLAAQLRERASVNLEEEAHSLCCDVVSVLQSRYPYMMGPVMVGHADCYERLGKRVQAGKRYLAVIANFRELAEIWAKQSESPTAADRISLQCLAYAIERLRALMHAHAAATLLPLREQCHQVLSRVPTPDPPIRDDHAAGVRMMEYDEAWINQRTPSERFRLYTMLTMRPIWVAALQGHCLPYLQDKTKELQQTFPQFTVNFAVEYDVRYYEIACDVGHSEVDSMILNVRLDEEMEPFIEVAEVYWQGYDGMPYTMATELVLLSEPLLCSARNLQDFAAKLPQLVAALQSTLQHIARFTQQEQQIITQTQGELDTLLPSYGFTPQSSSLSAGQRVWQDERNQHYQLELRTISELNTVDRQLRTHFLFSATGLQTIAIPLPTDAGQSQEEQVHTFITQVKQEAVQQIAAVKVIQQRLAELDAAVKQRFLSFADHLRQRPAVKAAQITHRQYPVGQARFATELINHAVYAEFNVGYAIGWFLTARWQRHRWEAEVMIGKGLTEQKKVYFLVKDVKNATTTFHEMAQWLNSTLDELATTANLVQTINAIEQIHGREAMTNALFNNFANHLRQRADVKTVIVTPFLQEVGGFPPCKFGVSAQRADGRVVEWWLILRQRAEQWVIEATVNQGEASAKERPAIIAFADKTATTDGALTEAIWAALQDLRATEYQEQVLGYPPKEQATPQPMATNGPDLPARQGPTWRSIIRWLLLLSFLMRLLGLFLHQ